MKAVIFGATGAVGRELVASLARQSHVSTIVAVTRSGPSSPSDADRWIAETFPSLTEPSHARKVQPAELDLDRFSARELAASEEGRADPSAAGESDGAQTLFSGAAYVGWALGTTKNDAGSAEAFERIDLGYCRAVARAAKREPTVRHFALVSSSGASSKSWFLYLKTKGRIEDFVRDLRFDRLSIYRPGLLNRGEKSRSHESFAIRFMKSTPVSAVADLMASHSNEDEGGVKVYEKF
mmetsp:Transcript_3011/g.5647  ORF Transcript_3011/g.5647 Transcript_3011/m.5647 type:complete len:238 (-) Transcript_3011:844-1557(-)